MSAAPAPLLRRASFWWVVFAVAVSVRTLHRPLSHTVFPVFAAGSLHWWQDESLYLDYKPLDYFRYPPTFAVAFTPFALLGPSAGGVLWSLTSLAVYWLGLTRFLRDVVPSLADEPKRSAFLTLSLVGGVAGLWNAQSNAALVGLLLLGMSAVVRLRWWSAALYLSLPIVFKLTPLPLVLLLVALFPRQLSGRLLAVTAAGFLMPLLTRTPEVVVRQHRDWVNHLVEKSGERWPGFRDGWTVFAVTRHRLAGNEGIPNFKEPIDSAWYRVVQVLSGLAVLAWSQRLKRRGMATQPLVLLTLSAGAGWLLLFGPAAELPTFVFLAPFLAWGLLADAKHRGLVLMAGALILVLGWGSLTRPLWDVAPWLLFALPAGVTCFLVWAGKRGGLVEEAATPQAARHRDAFRFVRA